LLPFIVLSCNRKPLNEVSEKDKEIIKADIKAVVDTIVKGCEDANFDMAMGPWLNSPDFVYIINGYILSYQDLEKGMKPIFDLLLNQKVTIISEKFSFLDKSTVLYTANTKWIENFKDGHSVLLDPNAWFILFRKIDNTWKAIYGGESYIEKPLTELPVEPVTTDNKTLSNQDKEVLITSTKPVLYQIIENSESGNLDKAVEPYLNSPEFIAVGNGQVLDFTGFKEGNKQYFDALDNQKFTEKDLRYTFIDNKTVIATWCGTGIANLKDGQKLNIDPYVVTLVFIKMDGVWKVIYTHESNVITPVKLQPKK